MANNNECWGLEIGSSAIKALKLERVDENSVRMVDYAVVQHPKVLSTPEVKADEVIRLSMQQLTSQYDLTKGRLAVSVPGNGAFARFCKLPPVEPKKVPDIVRFEAMQQIPVSLDEVEWDYQTFVTPDSPDVGVGIFAMRKDNLKERLQLLSDFGLTPNVITLSPLAVYNAMAYDLEFDATTPGTIMVDIGTTSTDIVIAEPGRMWIRTFPMGGHQFTEAIVQAFNLSYPKAEKLKREAEQTEHARRVFQEMRPVFTDLATEIQRSIGYYQSLHKDAKLARIIGVGSTFRLPGLRKYFKQQLGLEVYRIEEFKKIKPPEGFAAERIAAFNDLSLNMCSSFGLCLQGLELNACGGNLMPVAVTRDSVWRQKLPYFAAAAGIAVAASAAMFARPVMDSAKIKGRMKDQVIASAIETANRLKTEATKAGVVGAPAPSYVASNMMDLSSRRDVYPRIVNDVGEIVARGNGALKDWNTRVGGGKDVPAPAFALSDFRTQYEAPTGEPQPGAAPSGDADLQAHPRVRCTLEFTTDVVEPRRFVRDTVEKWLEENKQRSGVPYRIVKIEGAVRVDEPGVAANDPTPTAPIAAPGDMAAAPGRDDDYRRRRGMPGGAPGAAPASRPGMIMPPPPSSVPSPDFGPSNPDDTQSISRLNELAPVTAVIRPPGRTKVVVEWYSLVTGEPTKEGGAQ